MAAEGAVAEAAAAVRRLLEGALEARAAAGAQHESAAAAALLRDCAAAAATGATEAEAEAALARVQAALERTWEALNTGHWRAVPLARRQFYALGSLCKAWLLLQRRRPAAAPAPAAAPDAARAALRAALLAADRGLLMGAPLPLPGGQGEAGALAAAAALLSRALARLPAPSGAPCGAPSGAFPGAPSGAFSGAPSGAGATRRQEAEHSTSAVSTCVPAQPLLALRQPSLEHFAKEFFYPRRPVLLTGAADHWPARERWCNLEYLRRVAGARTVPVELGDHYADPEWAQQLMTIDDFVTKHIESETPIATADAPRPLRGYLAQHPLFDQIPELKNDICVPEYCCLSDDPNDALDPDINAWFGPKGTVSPLHYDPNHNLLTQVVGSKHVFLYSPEASESLYPHEGILLNNTAQVDPESPDYERFPLLRDVTALECILRPGDMLYIPPRWWHHVRSLSTSFSVSFWWE